MILEVVDHPDRSDVVIVRAKMELSEGSSAIPMESERIVSKLEFADIVASETKSREIANYLLGRMIVKWKLDLIKAMSDGVATAVAVYLSKGSSIDKGSTAPGEGGQV